MGLGRGYKSVVSREGRVVVAAVVVVVKWTGLKYPFCHLNSVPDFYRCSGANTEIIPKDSRVREGGSERRREVEREREGVREREVFELS